MWLTLLSLIERPSSPWGGDKLVLQEAAWFLNVRQMDDKIQFLYLFMHFLSNHGRSSNLFVGNAISITHFAQVCAQTVWRGILVLDPFDLENWMYVHSVTPNMLLDDMLDRLFVHLSNVMDLLMCGDAPDEKSYKPADQTIMQNIKVSQTLSLGLLNCNIFIRCMKMHMDDIMDLVKFVEASMTEDQKESFKKQLLRRRNTKRKVTALIGSTLVRSLLIFSIACAKPCSTDISISGIFHRTITPKQS